ncbi:MAG: TolC family protein [Pseudomonadales bacterium]|nr:TolC family protein [Pseudomonadales bacterium]
MPTQAKTHKQALSRSKVLATLCLPLILTGCYSLKSPPPEAERPLPFITPNTWNINKQSDASNDKTTTLSLTNYFGAHFPGFDYDILIKSALAGNYALRQLDTQLDSQIAKHRLERAGLWPSLNAGLNSQNNHLESTSSKLFSLQGNVSWTVDLWGTQRLLTRAAKNSVEEASLSKDAARLSVAAATLQNWFDWRSKKKLQQLQSDFVATLETSFQLVENRFNTGLASLLEVRLAHTEIALARTDLLQKNSNAINSYSKLLEILGEEYLSLEENPLFDDLSPSLPEEASPLPAYLPADIIRQRPDLLAAERRLKSQELQLLSSKKAWLPTLNLNGSKGLQDQSLNNLLKNGLSVSAITFNLLQPVFNAGAIKAKQAQVRASASKELYAYSEILHRAMIEVNRLLQQDALLKQQMEAAKFAAALATETQSLAKRNYNTGLTDLNTFLNTHRNSINTETRLINTTNDWLQNRVNLLLALGANPNFSQHHATATPS